MSNASPTLIFPNRIPAQAYPPKTIKTPTAIIHTAYSYASPPQKPQDGNWTRFVCISDTHQRVFPVPIGDVLLHSGDLTNTGQFDGAKTTAEWIYQMAHPIKIVIAGNHDLSFHRDWYQTNYYRWHRQKEDSAEILDLFTGTNARESGIVYLEDELYEFETREGGRKWTVFGSPWTPDFWNWAFNYKRGKEADDLVSNFTEADILLTHGPPRDILDQTLDGVQAGCESLRARLSELRPRLHVFGHIHEGHGVQVGEWHASETDSASPETQTDPPRTVFVNAANWPAGRRRKGPDGLAVSFAGHGFQPVIVDLLDEPVASACFQ